MKNKFFALFTILLSISLITTYSCKKEKDKSVSVTEVGLNKTSTTLIEGETETLVATVMPENATDKSVVWESGNESAATVSQEGLVTAVGEGKATITVKANDGGFSASCEVTVNKKVIAVTGVKLSAASMTLREGEKGTLTATVEPANATNKNVEWWTSDLDVVSVISTSGGSNGYVEARKAGKATVTVKTEDGEFSASCEITVEKKEVPVTGISIEPSSLKLPAGDADSLIPVEVKAKDNATISLNNLLKDDKYPDVKYGIKLCYKNIGFNGMFYTFPYFLTFLLKRYIAERLR